jgi:hypothetical protein
MNKKNATILVIILVIVFVIVPYVKANFTKDSLKNWLGIADAPGTSTTGNATTVPNNNGALDDTKVLQQGSKNAEVKALQFMLNAAFGANLPTTGYFGSLTLAALKKYCDVTAINLSALELLIKTKGNAPNSTSNNTGTSITDSISNWFKNLSIWHAQ